MNERSEKVWDVIVIGGGPAGMMAAARAGERGKQVLLLEKNARLGKKLSITGGGRCNVTNNKPEIRTMLERYKESGKFLFSTFSQHGVAESIAWFEERGVSLHEENEGRLFPDTNTASTICETLEKALTNVGVTTKMGVAVKEVVQDKKDVFTVSSQSGETYKGSSVVVSAGGRSRPDTGSTGDGFLWLEEFGHTIVDSSLALVPIVVKESWISPLSGVTMDDVKLTLFADGQKQLTVRGKVLCTHVGLSGPTILNMSSTIGELLQHSSVTLTLDLFPDDDEGTLRTKLRDLLSEVSNQKVRNSLSTWLPKALVTTLLRSCEIDDETPGHSLSSDDRKRLVSYMKQVPLTVARLLGSDKAVISGGGVALEEINFKTMESRLVPGLYIVGDMLNIDRPSGGYSLQLCWSTGFVAGEHAGE